MSKKISPNPSFTKRGINKKVGRVKFYVFLLIHLLLLSGGSFVFSQTQEWLELRGDHFIVFFRDAADFAKEVSRMSERYYTRIAADLGYARYSNFWQWDNRVKIFIYPGKEEFLRATGQPSWSVGQANYFKKEIKSYAGCREFLEATLPHEIAHLTFRDFVGFRGEIPLWLDEGVAQWQEKEKRQAVKFFVKKLFLDRRLLSLAELTGKDIRRTQDKEEALGFYVQAVSVVGFLIERYGADSFVQFCRQLRDGKYLDEALRFSYPTQLGSLAALEQAWLKYVSELEVTAKIETAYGNKVVHLGKTGGVNEQERIYDVGDGE